MNAKSVITAIALAIISLPASSAFNGGFPGRTVNAAGNQGTAVEGFYKSFEGSAIGARVSHRYNKDVVVFADFMQVTGDVDETGVDAEPEGNAMGAGFVYFRPGLVEGYDAAFIVSYHTVDAEDDSVSVSVNNINVDGLKTSIEESEISAQFIVSSIEPIADNSLQWYAGAGLHRITSDANFGTPNGGDFTINNVNVSEAVRNENGSDIEFGITAGVVLPTSFGQVYAAVENIDGNSFGVGARYILK